MMIGSGAARRPLGRTTIHVAAVLSLAFALLAGAAGYWGVVRAPELVTAPDDAAVIAASRTVARGLIKDRDGKVLASNKKDANGEFYRVYAGRAASQVVGYASTLYGRAGLERAYDAELTGLATDPLTDLFAKFGADRYDPQDLTLSLSDEMQRAAVAALGRAARGRGHARSAQRRDPRPGLDADVRRVGDRQPGDGPRDVRGAAGGRDAAAPPARDARPVRARVGVQAGDRRGRPRLRARSRRRRRSAASHRPSGTACWSTASGSRTAITRRPARPRST